MATVAASALSCADDGRPQDANFGRRHLTASDWQSRVVIHNGDLRRRTTQFARGAGSPCRHRGNRRPAKNRAAGGAVSAIRSTYRQQMLSVAKRNAISMWRAIDITRACPTGDEVAAARDLFPIATRRERQHDKPPCLYGRRTIDGDGLACTGLSGCLAQCSQLALAQRYSSQTLQYGAAGIPPG